MKMQVVRVKEIMTREVHSIDRNLGVEVALELMADKRVRRLPVVSNTGRVIGIITREDARTALERCRSDTDAKPPAINDVMTHNVVTIGPDESIAKAAQLMVKRRIGALPVISDGKMIGILTESDIFEYLASHIEMQD